MKPYKLPGIDKKELGQPGILKVMAWSGQLKWAVLSSVNTLRPRQNMGKHVELWLLVLKRDFGFHVVSCVVIIPCSFLFLITLNVLCYSLKLMVKKVCLQIK